MNQLRILILAPDCNPEGVSMPYVTYSHAAALARIHDVALVIGSPSETPVRRANGAVSHHRGSPDAIARAHLCLEFSADLQMQF